MKQMKTAVYTCVALCLCTFASLILKQYQVQESIFIILYMTGSIVLAWKTGSYLFGIIYSVAAVLLFNFFFIQPLYRFTIWDINYITTLIFMLIGSFVLLTINHDLQKEKRIAEEHAKRLRQMHQFTRDLLKVNHIDNIIMMIEDELSKLLGLSLRYASDENLNSSIYQKEIVGKVKSFGYIISNDTLDDKQDAFVQTCISSIALAFERETMYQKQEKQKVLYEKERLKLNLLRSVSHDLRTPLTVMNLATESLLLDNQLVDKDKEAIQEIHSEVQWLEKSVDNILQLTKTQDSEFQLNLQYYDVNEIISQVIRDIKRVDIDQRVQFDTCDGVIHVDGLLIIKVLLNLIENALQYSKKEILVKVEKKNKAFRFSVINEGEIEEDVRHKMFDLFYTSGNTIHRKGLGLGLAICKNSIEAHTSVLHVECKQEKTIFYFDLKEEDYGV